jgi:hypothetical protein
MDLAEIKKHYYAQPFRPIEVELSDGRRIRITRKLGMGFSPSGRTMGCFDHEDRSHNFFVSEVVAIRPLTPEPAGK